jgi:hypothetical protein
VGIGREADPVILDRFRIPGFQKQRPVRLQSRERVRPFPPCLDPGPRQLRFVETSDDQILALDMVFDSNCERFSWTARSAVLA